MRTLIRMFDSDDARWLILLVVAVVSFYALDNAWQLEAKVASQRGRIEDLELEARELTTQVQAIRRNCDGHWGHGSLCME